jgi:hypothetical protein
MTGLLFLAGCLTSWFEERVSEIIYALSFLILDAGVASFRMSRSRSSFVSAIDRGLR